MLNMKDIMETITMIQEEHLDIRTITMGISLLDCCDTDIDKSCEKVYEKICRLAGNLVQTGEEIEKKYGIPIVNKRVSVTPIAMLTAVSGGDPVKYAHALDKAAKKIGVNFIGGYTALVQKGFAAGDRELIESIPRALAETDFVCSSVNDWFHKSRHQHGRCQNDGQRGQGSFSADKRPAVHRRCQAGSLLQCAGR